MQANYVKQTNTQITWYTQILVENIYTLKFWNLKAFLMKDKQYLILMVAKF